MTTARQENGLSSRVARLEEGVEGLRGEMHSVNISLRDLSERLAKGARTDWQVYFSGLGVLLMFVLAIGGGALAPLYIMSQNNATTIATSVTSLTERLDGKIQSVNQIRENEMSSMDEVLQREMRLLNDAQDADAKHTQSQIDLLRDIATRLDDKLRSHEMLDGHPTAIQRHVETAKRLDSHQQMLQQQIRDLDTKLQREMELADQNQLERIRSLDDKLQAELYSGRPQ